MIDVQIAIADYAAEHELENNYTLRPSVDILGSGQEGDVRRQTSDGNYYIYDGGKWNLLLENTEIEEFELATKEDVLSSIKAGKEKVDNG